MNSVRPPVCLNLLSCLAVRLSVCVSITVLHVSLCICSSVCLSTCLSVYLWLSWWSCVSVCPYLHLFSSLSVSVHLFIMWKWLTDGLSVQLCLCPNTCIPVIHVPFISFIQTLIFQICFNRLDLQQFYVLVLQTFTMVSRLRRVLVI